MTCKIGEKRVFDGVHEYPLAKQPKNENPNRSSAIDAQEGINLLPDEILCHIFSYLGQNFSDMKSFSLVSKRWQNIAEEHFTSPTGPFYEPIDIINRITASLLLKSTFVIGTPFFAILHPSLRFHIKNRNQDPLPEKLSMQQVRNFLDFSHLCRKAFVLPENDIFRDRSQRETLRDCIEKLYKLGLIFNSPEILVDVKESRIAVDPEAHTYLRIYKNYSMKAFVQQPSRYVAFLSFLFHTYANKSEPERIGFYKDFLDKIQQRSISFPEYHLVKSKYETIFEKIVEHATFQWPNFSLYEEEPLELLFRDQQIRVFCRRCARNEFTPEEAQDLAVFFVKKLLNKHSPSIPLIVWQLIARNAILRAAVQKQFSLQIIPLCTSEESNYSTFHRICGFVESLSQEIPQDNFLEATLFYTLISTRALTSEILTCILEDVYGINNIIEKLVRLTAKNKCFKAMGVLADDCFVNPNLFPLFVSHVINYRYQEPNQRDEDLGLAEYSLVDDPSFKEMLEAKSDNFKNSFEREKLLAKIPEEDLS